MNLGQQRWRLSTLLGSLIRPGSPEDHEPEDSMAAVDDVARLVLSFNQSPEDATDARLQALMTADQGCQPLLQEFRQESLQRAPGSQAAEDGWSALDSAHRQFARGYEKFLMAHRDAAEESAAAAHLATIATRLLYHLTAVAKLEFFRARPLEARLWHLAHQVFSYVENAGLMQRILALYDAPERVETTCERVYARLLMLDTLNGGGFNPRQLEVADTWLAEWLGNDVLAQDFMASRFRYQCDVSGTSGPVRLMNEPFAGTIRFIDTESTCVQIERLRSALRSGQMSGLMGLGSGFTGVDFVDLLDRLERVWSLAWIGQEQRVHRRERIENGALEVVRGLGALCQAARRDVGAGGTEGRGKGALTPAEEMDIKIYGFVTERTKERMAATPSQDQPTERWLLFDQSASGYGAVIPARDEGNLRPGVLLGVREPGQKRWSVAVVARRVALRDSGEIFVGLEVLSRTPVIVSIEPQGRELAVAGPLAIPAGRENQWSLFLPGPRDLGKPDTLVIDASIYSTGRQFNLAARNAAYSIRMNRIVGKGDGWQRIGFEVLAKRT